jgi:MoaA/NifB/PqqE/SkfB family radical SAM enzyme
MFLGGEPTVYKHLAKLVDFCNKEEVLYTVITNMTDYSYNKIRQIIDEVGYLNGLSFTVDPVLWDENYPKDDDRYRKSKEAYEKFITFRNDPRVREFVGIVGVDSQNIRYLHRMCEDLTKAGVWIDLILLETKLNKYYDFPSPLDYDLLVWDTEEHRRILMEAYEKAEKGEYTVLFHPVIKYKMVPNLPQKYICTIDKRMDTMTIDADGKLRLCLRIRGVKTQEFHMLDILDEDGNLTDKFQEALKAMQWDKKNFCYGCQWTCPMAGELIADGLMSPELMNHRGIEIQPR